MIKEAYVSFEVAKLLKEKGFNWRTQYVYTSDGTGSTPPKIGNWKAKSDIQKPTQQMAMRWLREQYDLHIIAFPYKANDKKKWCCQVYKTFNLLGYGKYINDTLDSYEDAVEAAIKYSLENLI